MSTENVEVFNKYYGNGVATQFSIGFPYLRREFVKVYLYKKETNEEVMLSSDQFAFVNDATIEYPVLPTDEVLKEGDILTVQRETELGSDFEFDNQRRLFPVEVMNADDLGFQQIQELAREVKRSLRVKPTAAETSDELLDGIYERLESTKEVTEEAIAAAGQATEAAAQAVSAVEEAQKQIAETQEYVDEAKGSIDEAIRQATDDVKQAALDAAQESIDTAAAQATEIVRDYAENTIGPALNAAATTAAKEAALASESAREAKVWARGEDEEVEEFAPGEDEHSSRGYADLSMALANTPEDVPVDVSTLLALEIFKGPKGDKGDKGDQGIPGVDGLDGKDGENGINGRSVGDIFYTIRTEKDYNGAVECDGGTYYTKDFTGEQAIGTMLADGKLPYVTTEEYESTVTEKGYCGVFGWDNGDSFRVPTIPGFMISKEEAAVVGNGMTLGLTNGSQYSGIKYSTQHGIIDRVSLYGTEVGSTTTDGTESVNDLSLGITTDPEKSGIISNLPTIQVKAMVVLATSVKEVSIEDYTRRLTETADAEIDRINNNTYTGDKVLNGTFNAVSDDNHPIKVTGMAGTTASGFQVVDNYGQGESDFEHYATGDRYGTRIANKSNATGTTVSVDLYQTTAGKSVLDLSKPDTILAPQLLDVIYPIGSYYFSEELKCPLEDIMDQCEWELVAGNIGSLVVNVFRRIM